MFDELVWVDKAREEHNAFSETIAGTGVRVLHLSKLLEDVLIDSEVALEFVETHVTEDLCGRRLADRVRGFLIELAVPELVRYLIGGVTLQEVGETEGLVAAVHGRTISSLLLCPMPSL